MSADEDETRTASLERFADKKLSGAHGPLSADQTALYADIISAMGYTRRLEARVASLETALREGIAMLDRVYGSASAFSHSAREWRGKARAALSGEDEQ